MHKSHMACGLPIKRIGFGAKVFQLAESTKSGVELGAIQSMSTYNLSPTAIAELVALIVAIVIVLVLLRRWMTRP